MGGDEPSESETALIQGSAGLLPRCTDFRSPGEGASWEAGSRGRGLGKGDALEGLALAQINDHYQGPRTVCV
jgi:hypothetical protein